MRVFVFDVLVFPRFDDRSNKALSIVIQTRKYTREKIYQKSSNKLIQNKKKNKIKQKG